MFIFRKTGLFNKTSVVSVNVILKSDLLVYIKEYLEELLINFSFYISGIYNKKCAYLRAYEHAYRDVRKMLATQDIDMAELKKFICLNDIMRNDLR